jgi:hypothetical protein
MRSAPTKADWSGCRERGGPASTTTVRNLAQRTAPAHQHLDLTVPNRAELDAAHQRALALGAQVLMDRSDDEDEPLWVYADLAGQAYGAWSSRPPVAEPPLLAR